MPKTRSEVSLVPVYRYKLVTNPVKVPGLVMTLARLRLYKGPLVVSMKISPCTEKGTS